MKEVENISNELSAIAPALVPVSRQMPFEVPEGYFESLSAEILAKVAPPVSGSMTDVPAGYFESFPEMMLRRVKMLEANSEIAEIAPTLAGMARSMPYAVPDGYFEQLEPMLSVNDQKPAAKVRGIFSSRWMRVAAGLALLFAAFTIWKMSNTSNSGQADMAVISHDATDTLPTDLSVQLSQLDDEALATYLGETGVNAENRSQLYYLNTENFEQALQEFSADELKEQLESTPTGKKNI